MRAIFFDTMFFMFAVICFLAVVFSVFGCVEHIPAKEYDCNSWDDNAHITVMIDNSVDEQWRGVVEDSFHRWLDYTDSKIEINFEYGECEYIAGNSCVDMYDDLGGYLGTATVSCAAGRITWGRVSMLRQTTENFSMEHVIMHEVGHFFGMQHSDDPTDTMYPTTQIYADYYGPTQNDISAIRALYN